MRKAGSVALVSLLVLAGCAGSREKQDLRRSGYIFYPFVKLGDGLAALGGGIRDISTPFTARPPAYKGLGSGSRAQEHELAKFSIPYSRDEEPRVQQVGHGLGAWGFPEPWRSVLTEAEDLAGSSYDWRIAPQLEDGAMSFPLGVIAFNPYLLAQLRPDPMLFGLLHEIGHQELGHTSYEGIIVGMQQPWLKKYMELDADVWAAKCLREHGWSKSRIMLAAISLLGRSPDDGPHPSGMARCARVRAVLDAQDREDSDDEDSDDEDE